MDSPAYNDLKKSLYLLNQALGNVVFTSQSYYDYYGLYKYQNPASYQADYNAALSKLTNAENYLASTYNDYQRALNAYKASLALGGVPPPVLSDQVPITQIY